MSDAVHEKALEVSISGLKSAQHLVATGKAPNSLVILSEEGNAHEMLSLH